MSARYRRRPASARAPRFGRGDLAYRVDVQPWQALPSPAAHPYAGHLPRWGRAPLALLEEGAALGKLFALRLGVPAVVGYGPAWNKRLLGDTATFVSRGGFSALVPHLAGGVILTDAPGHRARKAELNRPFSRRALETLTGRVSSALTGVRPQGEFDALAWADRAALAALNAAYFSGEFPPAALHAFLAPLRAPFPAPMWPRPLLFARTRAELRRLAGRRLEGGGDDVLAHLARLPGGLIEARVSLAAAHDTTTHTLAWALWLLARHPEWRAPGGLGPLLKETLRLYPTGWIGSRRLAAPVDFEGTRLPKGTLALYSPYLSGRDSDFWDAPDQFRPERWERPPPAWSYLPFGGGARLCLGVHLANLLLTEALALFLEGDLIAVRGDPTPQPGVTIGPRGPLVVKYRR